MRTLIPVVLFLLNITVLIPVRLTACEISFTIEEKKAGPYQTGDTVLATVRVEFTHRVCPEGIQGTKFSGDGISIHSATAWKELSPGIWERKLKLVVTGNGSEKVSLTAARTCRKEGGKGILELPVVP